MEIFNPIFHELQDSSGLWSLPGHKKCCLIFKISHLAAIPGSKEFQSPGSGK